ncbi:MAG: Trm112 family protein [Caulobacteraceae bacterium]
MKQDLYDRELTPDEGLLSRLARSRHLASSVLHSLPEVLRERRLALQEDRRHQARPPREGLVVDVGAGQGSHGRANMIIDKYVVDAFERSGEIDLSRPLVVADGHQLPIRTGAISYIIASHVLEHATDPALFASELSRVALAGFVQVPSREAELTFGWPFHHWLVDLAGDTLVFRPKGDTRAWTGDLLHSGFIESPGFRLWFDAHRTRWHHSLEWRGKINIEVDGPSTPEAAATFELQETMKALSAAHKRGVLRSLTPALWSILCCPVCHGDLGETAEAVHCTSCGRAYPVAGGTPILIETVAS